MTPREFVDSELKIIRQIWYDNHYAVTPTCVLIKDEKHVFIPVPFQNDAQKHIYSMSLKELVRRTEPDIVVFWTEAWAVHRTIDQIETRASEQPDKIEILMVQVEFKTGEKFGGHADIIRTDGEPKLSEFTVEDARDAMGQFVDFYPIARKDQN